MSKARRVRRSGPKLIEVRKTKKGNRGADYASLGYLLLIIACAAILASGTFVGAKYHFSAMDAGIRGDIATADRFTQIARWLVFSTAAFALLMATGVLLRSRSITKRLGGSSRTRKRRSETNVPKTLRLMIGLITSPRDRDVVLGDYQERFEKDVRKHGRRGALSLLVRDILADIPANAWSFLRRVVRLVIVGTIVERVFFR